MGNSAHSCDKCGQEADHEVHPMHRMSWVCCDCWVDIFGYRHDQCWGCQTVLDKKNALESLAQFDSPVEISSDHNSFILSEPARWNKLARLLFVFYAAAGVFQDAGSWWFDPGVFHYPIYAPAYFLVGILAWLLIRWIGPIEEAE